jgi:hypothetical protein
MLRLIFRKKTPLAKRAEGGFLSDVDLVVAAYVAADKRSYRSYGGH